jgi:hypothetical protein
MLASCSGVKGTHLGARDCSLSSILVVLRVTGVSVVL